MVKVMKKVLLSAMLLCAAAGVQAADVILKPFVLASKARVRWLTNRHR